MQRFFDILFSGLTLLALSPLMLPLIFILRFTGEGEIFFMQKRVGKNGQYFNLLKFATMLKDSPNLGTGTVTLKNDPRILPLGSFFRKTKINELPQLINIFKGDMSIIGPRPQTQRCFNAFPDSAKQAILKVRPGLSGVGSIVFRNEENMMHINNDPDFFYDKIIMPYKGSLEQWYVNNYNIYHYVVLILLTIWIILFSDSKLAWKLLNDLPKPPKELKEWM